MHKKSPPSMVSEYRRAFVRPTKRTPADRQVAALIEAGAGAIYVMAKHQPLREEAGARIYTNPDAHDVWLRSLDADCVALVTTMGRLGSTRQEIAAAVKRIHKAGSHLVEIVTGRRSDDIEALPIMMADAADELSGVRQRRFDSKGAKEARAAQLQVPFDRLPKSHALVIWRDVEKYPTAGDALAAMPGWALRTAYKHLREREPGNPRRGGRPAKTKRKATRK